MEMRPEETKCQEAWTNECRGSTCSECGFCQAHAYEANRQGEGRCIHCTEMSPTEEMKAALSESFGIIEGEFMVFGGGFCKLFDPNVDVIDIRVIEHALGNLCRFNGHTRDFYSVAQHSVLVSQQVPPRDALHGLMHDASEAYLGDIIRPLKYAKGMRVYLEIEKLWQRVIFETFKMIPVMPNSVKLADNRLLMTEFRDLFARTPPGLDQSVKPYEHFKIKALPPKEATQLFMDRWEELTTLQGMSR